MIFNNSENAMAIVLETINAKKAVALESFHTMNNTRKGAVATLTLEAVSGIQEFFTKVKDVYEALQNIDIDEAEVISVLKNISNVPTELRDSSIEFISPDNVGRINPSYIQDFAQNIMTTADKILRGEVTAISATNISSIVVEGIKSQIAQGTYKGTSAKKCFEELPGKVSHIYDKNFVSTCAVPFVKSFTSKRTEIAAEIAILEKCARAAFAIIEDISNSKEILSADTDSRQLLNVYLSAAGTALIDIVSFTSYLLIRKMDIMIVNATAINEICDDIRSSIGVGSVVESVDYSLDTTDMLLGTVNGIYGKIKYNILNYYGETSHPIDDMTIASMLDGYRQLVYPAEEFINILEQKRDILSKFKDTMCTQEYPSPGRLAIELGLLGENRAIYAAKIRDISDISIYTNNDSMGAADKAFAALAELKSLKTIIEKIRMRGNEIAVILEEIRSLAYNPTEMISKSETVRDELIKVTEAIAMSTTGKLIPDIYTEIDKRCMSLDAYIGSILTSTKVIVPDLSEVIADYMEDALQSIIADEEIYANREITEAARAFYGGKSSVTFLATEAEAPATNPGGATPGNPIATDTAPAATPTTASAPSTGSDSNKSVEVQENPNQQSATDAAQNAAAATEKKKDPNSFKEMLKKLIDEAMKLFDNTITKFSNAIKGKRIVDAEQYLTQNKDAILNRSFNGVQLRIPFFPDLNTDDVAKEIGQVTAAVGALNAQSIKTSSEEQLATVLFPFIKGGDANTPAADRIKMIQARYVGEDRSTKEEYSGAKLRAKTQEMMAFCEEYYINKKCESIARALTSLKESTRSTLSSLSSISDPNAIPEDSKVRFINSSIKVFASAITNTYRNKATAYYSALKSLTPKQKKAPVPVSPSPESQPAEQSVEPTT